MDKRTERQIARINELSALARPSWIGLLAYLAYIFVTLLGVEDADFFVPSRQTTLPIVQVSIPTIYFFTFAPLLAAALYVYLHLFLIKLWDAIADAPPRVRLDDEHLEWIPLCDAIHPWLANDLACAVKGNGAQVKRPLRRLGGFVTMFLVWAAGPAVIFAFWLVSTGAHNEWLTLGIAASLWFAVLAMLSSMVRATAKLKERPIKAWHNAAYVLAMLLFTWTLAKESWLRTEGGFEHYARMILPLWHGDEYETLFRTCDPETQTDCFDEYGEPWPEDIIEERRIAALPWLPRTDPDYLMLTNLFEADMVPLPETWRDWDIARMEFRETWCRREGLPMETCDHRHSADRDVPRHVTTARANYCKNHDIGEDSSCTTYFNELDSHFDRSWEDERESLRNTLAALKLSGKDLRGVWAPRASFVNADLRWARLEGADLIEARLEGANLSLARLEGANLSLARLEGADLSLARLEGANLRWARLEGANLWEARLEGASLWRARLEGADLSGARLEGADLRGARLEGASLWRARLEGANLSGARLEGANLIEARLEGADLSWARLEGADLRRADLRSAKWAATHTALAAHFADLRGAQDLTQAQLDQMIGNTETLLPETLADDSSPSIPSCWPAPPEFLNVMVESMASRFWDTRSAEQIRSDLLCSEGEQPQPTGTPCTLDFAREICLNPAPPRQHQRPPLLVPRVNPR